MIERGGPSRPAPLSIVRLARADEAEKKATRPGAPPPRAQGQWSSARRCRRARRPGRRRGASRGPGGLPARMRSSPPAACRRRPGGRVDASTEGAAQSKPAGRYRHASPHQDVVEDHPWATARSTVSPKTARKARAVEVGIGRRRGPPGRRPPRCSGPAPTCRARPGSGGSRSRRSGSPRRDRIRPSRPRPRTAPAQAGRGCSPAAAGRSTSWRSGGRRGSRAAPGARRACFFSTPAALPRCDPPAPDPGEAHRNPRKWPTISPGHGEIVAPGSSLDPC